MKKSVSKLTGLILLFTLISVFMVIAYNGTTNVVIAQNRINSSNLNLSGEEILYSPYIEVCLGSCGYAEPPSIYIHIWDDVSLDSAYYQIDAHTPLGTNTANWTVIFENYEGISYENESFLMNSTIFTHLAEGLHVIYFKAWDDDGNVTDGADFYKEFYKDTIPPDYLAILSPVEGEVISDQLILEARAYDNDGGSGIAVVKFFTSEDEPIGDVWEPYYSDHYKLVKSIKDVPEGEYEIYAFAYDCAGNKIQTETISFTIEHKPNTLLIVVLSVGAVAGVATTFYVVKFRHRPTAYEKTVSKLGHVKQPMSAKMSTAASESGEPLYLLPEESASMGEISEIINQIPLSETQKQELSIELQRIPTEERVNVLKTIIGPISPTEAKDQLNSLMHEIEHLEQEEKWSELINKLDKGVELAEFLGDQTILNKLLAKIDEIQAHSN